MNRIVRVIVVTALAFGSGCARSDWIPPALFTRNVAGVWYGELRTSLHRMEVSIDLRQEGGKVEGSLLAKGFVPALLRDVPGPVEGTVNGGQLELRQATGPLRADLTVRGDEMAGPAHTGFGPGQFLLRRVDAPARVDAP
jgi:hypothetical protein